MTRRVARQRDLAAEVYAQWAAEHAAPQRTLPGMGLTVTKPSRRLRVARKPSGALTQRPRRRRGTRREPAPSATPLACVVLAVDTAARSGWAGMTEGGYLGWGEADTLDRASLDYIVQWAVHNATARGLQPVLVLEAPFGGPMSMLMGLGAARERWLAAWREAGLPRTQVVSVQPAEWRARVLGRGWARAPRAEVRAHEQVIAAAVVGERVRADEAAAILIARWALRAAKVARVLQPSAARRAPR